MPNERNNNTNVKMIKQERRKKRTKTLTNEQTSEQAKQERHQTTTMEQGVPAN